MARSVPIELGRRLSLGTEDIELRPFLPNIRGGLAFNVFEGKRRAVVGR